MVLGRAFRIFAYVFSMLAASVVAMANLPPSEAGSIGSGDEESVPPPGPS